MGNIFVFSDSYITKAVIHCIEYMHRDNEKLGSVYVLRENHRQDEFPKHYRVVIAQSLQECLNACDICLIYKSERITEPCVERIRSEAQQANVTCCCIDLQKKSVLEEQRKKKSVTVLIVRYGTFTQQYYTEFALASAFRKNNIAIAQEFSTLAATIMESLEFLKQNEENGKRGLAVIALETPCLETFDNDTKIRSIVHALRPEYVILSTNGNTELSDEVFKRFYYLYGKKIDCVVRSEYVPFVVRGTEPVPLRCILKNKEKNAKRNIMFVDDMNVGDLLFEDIHAKLAIPKDIHLL
ncbi:MAG: hypothetical protein J6B85_08820 [Lachnospiraceae bacterium]|nr:hypothetical protein [Lachnospiraceae bacterium]